MANHDKISLQLTRMRQLGRIVGRHGNILSAAQGAGSSHGWWVACIAGRRRFAGRAGSVIVVRANRRQLMYSGRCIGSTIMNAMGLLTPRNRMDTVEQAG